jgi:hypothetical protein
MLHGSCTLFSISVMWTWAESEANKQKTAQNKQTNKFLLKNKQIH